MKFFINLILYLISIPARLCGIKLGRHSFLGPGYDFLFINFNGINIGDNVFIGRNAWFGLIRDHKSNPIIQIGENTNIGRFLIISSADSINIGKNCLLSYNVSLMDHDHVFNSTSQSPLRTGTTKGKQINIGDHCFIGAHSFILKGVTLGRHCVVGANSVVTKSFPDYSVIAGSPARLITSQKITHETNH